MRLGLATTRTMALLVLLSTSEGAEGPEDPRPGFNLFSVQQDIEIGRQSAAQAERQLRVLREPALERYLNEVAQPLVEAAPGARYPYRVRAVDASEINAFTFPGGFLYVNRGLLEATRNESELAGVLAHEIAHVALRHGTHQASKAYAAQAGLGILGGLLGRGGQSTTDQIILAVGGLGLNAVFLKFSRSDELEADLVGVRLLKKAGYDTAAMASFFELLQERQRREPGRLEQFFSSHPAPSDRAERMRAEAERLGPGFRPRPGERFAAMQKTLGRRPSAAEATVRPREGSRPLPRDGERASTVAIPDPSARLRTFEQRTGLFAIAYPSNWRALAAPTGYGVVLAPDGGLEDRSGSSQDVVCGVIVNHYEPFEGAGDGSLDDATSDLVDQILRSHPHLREVRARNQRRDAEDGRERSVLLQGRSPTTGEEERVHVLTRGLPDGHVLYALFVVPRGEAPRFEPTFTRMAQSLRVDDRLVHR